MWVVGVLLASAGCANSERVDQTSATTGPPAAQAVTTSLVPTTPAVDPQAALDDWRLSYGAPGAVAVVRNGETEWTGVSGVADLTGTKLSDGTRFRIASITKPIVALLVLDAVARGELSLEDTVSDLIPGVLRPDPPITVRMLLDHTSGVFNVGDEGDIVADITKLADPALRREALDLGSQYLAGEPVSIRDRLYVALAETHERYFEPGAGYHYSNVNYQTAAMVLEKATGSPIADLLRSRLVEPLGLRHTTIAPGDRSSPEMHGYGVDADDGSLVDLTDDFLTLGNGGSGGVISTTDELLTVMQAIVSGRLLPAPLVEEMKHATLESDQAYGLGLATYYLSCGTFYGHGGAVSGTQSIALVSPDGAAGVVIAINLRTEVEPNLLALAETLICS
jgi:D-alanyl-D-alanine carboxypeptidase